jgi:hypothetical protein
MRFFKHAPRIECATDLNDIPSHTVVFAEFPMASAPKEVRRGIPYGFSRDDTASINGIVPAIRWSDYSSREKLVWLCSIAGCRDANSMGKFQSST